MNTRHILFGTLGLLFLLVTLAACAPETAAPGSAAEVIQEEVEEVAAVPTETAVPDPIATDLPAPRVEETANAESNTVAEAEEEVVEDTDSESTEETVEEMAEEMMEEETDSELAETEETEGDLAVAPEEPFFGRTAEGAFTIGYNSAPVKIIDYSDFL